MVVLWFFSALFICLIYTSNLRAHLIKVPREKEIKTIQVNHEARFLDSFINGNYKSVCTQDVHDENVGVYFQGELHDFLRGSASDIIRGIIEKTFRENLFLKSQDLDENGFPRNM